MFCCGLRVVSIDGSVTDVPDSPKNAAFFGRPSSQSRDGAFPQARWVAAAESGTGSLLGAAIGRYTDAEQPLAADLLGCFGPGMLVLADRKFLSWAAARAFLVLAATLFAHGPAAFGGHVSAGLGGAGGGAAVWRSRAASLVTLGTEQSGERVDGLEQ